MTPFDRVFHNLVGNSGVDVDLLQLRNNLTAGTSSTGVGSNDRGIARNELRYDFTNGVTGSIAESENIQKSNINARDNLNLIRRQSRLISKDLKETFSTQSQENYGHTATVLPYENTDAMTLPQIALEGIRHAAFSISGSTEDIGTNSQPPILPKESLKLPSSSPTISQIYLSSKKNPLLPAYTRLSSPLGIREQAQSSISKMPLSKPTAGIHETTTKSNPHPVNTLLDSQAPLTPGKSITPSNPPKALPSVPNTNGFPTLPPVLLARPLKYYDNMGEHPHLHAGKMKLFVPTGVGINGSATNYEAKEVYPPYRYVSKVGGKKLIPVYSGDNVIALVPAGSYLKQNNTVRAHRRGIIPIPPANMAQLRRQTAFNPPSKRHIAVHLEFDQYQGDLMLDTSGHENHALATGAATRMVANYSCGMAERLIGGQISFNGSSFAPKPTFAVTVAAWIKLSSSEGRQSIFYTVGRGQYNLAAEDGKIVWSHMDDRENVIFKLITMYQYLKPNKWAHIAGTYDSVEGLSMF